MGDAISTYIAKILAEEIKKELEGKHLNKVQQLGENVFRITFSAPKKDLIIEPGRRMHLTDYVNESPEKASQVSMLLRKHLSAKRVKNVYARENDRIIVLEFEGFKLITEFFSNGNFVLTDDDYKILFTFRSEEWKDRELKRGAEYKFPPNMMNAPREDYSPSTKENVEKLGINKALDDYYSNIKAVNEKLVQLQNRLAFQNKAMEEYQKLADEERNKGDLIYGNYSKVDEVLKLLKENNQKELLKLGIIRKGKKVVIDL